MTPWSPDELGTAIVARAFDWPHRAIAELLKSKRPGITENAVKCRMHRLPEPISDEKEAA